MSTSKSKPWIRDEVARAAAISVLGLSVLALSGCLAESPPQPGKPQHLPTTTLSIADHNILAEMAVTDEQRTIGLMHRASLPDSVGMVFAYPNYKRHCFWMKNTHVPLDVAFVDRNGFIVNIAAMRPLSEKLHCAERPVRHVLEMNKGWFGLRGITQGAKVEGLDKVKAADGAP